MDKQVIHFTSVPIPHVEIAENAMPLNVLALRGMFKNQEIQAIHPHAKAALKSFFVHFNKIKTAGGLVYHPQSDAYLWIKRLGLWDLPKGKIEKHEDQRAAALREVMEETGISHLILEKLITTTTHQYHDKYLNKEVEKTTYWYAMTTDRLQDGKPQSEEDIEAIAWVKKEDIAPYLANTYDNIKAVMEEFLTSKH